MSIPPERREDSPATRQDVGGTPAPGAPPVNREACLLVGAVGWVMPLVSTWCRQFRPVIDRVYRFEELAEAYRRVDAGTGGGTSS
jgi:hypothetical protein